MANDDSKNPDAPAAKPSDVRQPYEPPRIVTREKIEGRANVCSPPTGKTTAPACGVAKS